MSFTPSIYQQRVFDFIQRGSGSAIINAVAGSGKTTTIVKATELIPASQSVTFLAFNKKIATELQSRVPAHVKAATFHSQGFSAWRRFSDGSVTVDGDKLRNLVKREFTSMEIEAFGATIQKLVGIAKSSGIGSILPDEPQVWLELADHYDIALSEIEEVKRRTIDAARMLLAKSIVAACADASVIDFDDMLYMPLIKDCPFYKVDWLFVDEAQDTNAVQLALLRRMLKPGGRLVAVGDPKQAIYGFRGADASAMLNITQAFNCQELPLTISYRCAQSVVRLAQTLVPYIEAAPTAPEGEILHVGMNNVVFTNKDVIICRNTAPLVELAFTLIGKGTGCKVLGREIGAQLTSLVNKMGVKELEPMLGKLDQFCEREVAKFLSKGQEERAEAVKDKVECIRAIANSLVEGNRTYAALIRAIEGMFSDNGDGLLTLCTAHKSKGLEWERVFIYRSELMPSKWARQAWQKEQESNLQYVAWTRAKRILVFLTDSVPAKEVKPEVKREETNREYVVRRCLENNWVLEEFWVE